MSRRRFYRTALNAVALLGIFAGTASFAHAQIITVPNFSFESPTTGDFSLFTGADWQYGAGISSAGVLNFSAVSGSYSVSSAPDGLQIGFLNENGTAGIYQDLSTTFVLGDTYSLSIYFGARTDDAGASGAISLLDSSGNLLATSGAVDPASGTFQQATIFYTATLAEAGQPIQIQIVNTSFPVVQLNFDYVQLTASPVPEPSTWGWCAGLLGLGVAAFRKLRRRSV